MAHPERKLRPTVIAEWKMEFAQDHAAFDQVTRLGVRISHVRGDPIDFAHVTFKEVTSLDDIVTGLLSLAEQLERLK